MKKLATGVLAGALVYGPGLLLAQQQSPSPTTTSPSSQDVPHQAPGSNNPDLQSQRKPAPKKGVQQSGAGKSTQNNPDVPHQEPGTDNPDVGKQRQPTAGTSTSTQSSSASKRKSKRRKQNSTASQTRTSS